MLCCPSTQEVGARVAVEEGAQDEPLSLLIPVELALLGNREEGVGCLWGVVSGGGREGIFLNSGVREVGWIPLWSARGGVDFPM